MLFRVIRVIRVIRGEFLGRNLKPIHELHEQLCKALGLPGVITLPFVWLLLYND